MTIKDNHPRTVVVSEGTTSEDPRVFYQAVAAQSEEKILRFSESPQIEAVVVEKDGNPFESKYKHVSVIAENASTSIEVVEDESAKKYVRKSKRDNEEIALLHERGHDFLRAADHPAFPKAHAFFSGTVDEQMVSTSLRDHIEGRNLEQIVKDGGALELKEAIHYALQVLDGLSYAHQKGVLLRDIKPSQFIREDGTDAIKIIDVDSLGTLQTADRSDTVALTVYSQKWQHPEGQTPMAGVHTELFAAGTTLYYLLTSAEPEYEKNEKGQYTLTQQKWFVLEKKFGRNPGCRELIRTIKGMIEPTAAMKYDSTREVMMDLETIDRILLEGYSWRDAAFRLKGKDAVGKMRDKVSEITKRVPVYTLSGALLGVAVGLPIGGVLAHQEERENATTAVYERVEDDQGEADIIESMKHLFNLVNDVHRFSIETAKGNEERPNDIAQGKTLFDFNKRANETSTLLFKARDNLTSEYGTAIADLRQALVTYQTNPAESKIKLSNTLASLARNIPLRIEYEYNGKKDALGRDIIDKEQFDTGRAELFLRVEQSYNALQQNGATIAEDISSRAQECIRAYDGLMESLGNCQSQLKFLAESSTTLQGKIQAGGELASGEISELYQLSLSAYNAVVPEARITANSVSHTSAKPFLTGLAILLLGVGGGAAAQAMRGRR